tara:strand:- start:506 stop:661 length:156 start_codon:yes stop_codon:yes gene_type:complete
MENKGKIKRFLDSRLFIAIVASFATATVVSFMPLTIDTALILTMMTYFHFR